MRLTKVQVTSFRSIRDSGEFDIGDVTCLVGKNEAGKSAVLQALYRLNPIVPEHSVFDVTADYPRSDVEDYQQEVEKGTLPPANVTTATFELSNAEVDGIEKAFGSGVLRSRFAKLFRGYANATGFEIALNEDVAVRHLASTADLPETVRADAMACTTLATLASRLARAGSDQEAQHKAALAAANTLPDPTEQAKARDEANRLQESQSAKHLRDELAKITKPSFHGYVWKTHLEASVPKFLYFDEYYQMAGQVNVESLKQRLADKKLEDADRPMLGLIDLARLNIDQLLAAKDTQALLNKIEGASNHLSSQILKYWSQNRHILVRFDLRPGLPGDPVGMRSGMNLWGFVHDSKHLATTGLGTRSRGFVWFFSFLAWFSQQKKANKPMILLLDEPGLFLHASAQADLLRYIEHELKPHHQVMFSTHSPFMVDPTQFSRVRIVRDRSMESDADLPPEQRGTKVSTDVLEADEESLFPLQGALGFSIAQTLFVGPNCLIVEGVSDLLYVQAMSGALQAAGREGLDAKWTITPVGGSDKVPTFVALLGAQKNLKVATLIDIQAKDKQQVENLYRRKLLARANVMNFGDYVEREEADIEDMFDPQFFLDLVNLEYRDQLARPVSLADLTSKHPRILVRLEAHLRVCPLKSGSFNHYRPARYFAEHAAALTSKADPATLGRFEAAFKSLNALL